MKLNILSSITTKPDGTPTLPPELFRCFNEVVSWSLKKEFEKLGIEVRLVYCTDIIKREMPAADNTLVVSASTVEHIRGTPGYAENIRRNTAGLVTMYLDADLNGYELLFDKVFTVVKPHDNANKKFIYAGWGADPTLFYPEQTETTIFLDSFDPQILFCHAAYESMLTKVPYKVLRPVKLYGTGRIPWAEMQKLLRQTTHFCCTQIGESGLPRVEAATCGAILVVPKDLYRERTMGTLPHAIWSTEDELLSILSSRPDVQENRRMALEHSWSKAADRILTELP